MDWIELTIDVSTADLERASAIVTLASDGGLYIEDYSDMLETLPTIGYYDYIGEELLSKDTKRAKIHAYFHENAPLAEAKHLLAERLAAAGMEFAFEERTIRESDYANAWKKHFHPVRIGKTLVVRPSWEEYAPKEGDRVLTIDPEMAFGTGDHETTRLCLEALECTVKGGERVLDMGCGSGILSVAALLFGAREVVAVDIDANAVDIAKKNAAINGFSGGEVTAFAGNASEDENLAAALGGAFDIVTANIVADVIKAQAAMYFNKLKRGGTLIASGIIDVRCDEVRGALERAGFAVIGEKQLRGWTELRAFKPAE